MHQQNLIEQYHGLYLAHVQYSIPNTAPWIPPLHVDSFLLEPRNTVHPSKTPDQPPLETCSVLDSENHVISGEKVITRVLTVESSGSDASREWRRPATSFLMPQSYSLRA